jgi:hypothetical protein
MKSSILQMLCCATVAAAIFAATLEATAEPSLATANDVLRAYERGDPLTRKSIEDVLKAEEDGLSWANAWWANRHHDSVLYCPPKNLALTGPQVLDILRRGVTDDPKLRKSAYGLAVLIALRRTFPCSKSSN